MISSYDYKLHRLSLIPVKVPTEMSPVGAEDGVNLLQTTRGR